MAEGYRHTLSKQANISDLFNSKMPLLLQAATYRSGQSQQFKTPISLESKLRLRALLVIVLWTSTIPEPIYGLEYVKQDYGRSPDEIYDKGMRRDKTESAETVARRTSSDRDFISLKFVHFSKETQNDNQEYSLSRGEETPSEARGKQKDSVRKTTDSVSSTPKTDTSPDPTIEPLLEPAMDPTESTMDPPVKSPSSHRDFPETQDGVQIRESVENQDDEQFWGRFLNTFDLSTDILPNPFQKIALSLSHPPSSMPSEQPSLHPSGWPSQSHSTSPTRLPTIRPSFLPTQHPTASPSIEQFVPTSEPAQEAPSHSPSTDPSQFPSLLPTRTETRHPSSSPSQVPSDVPSHPPSEIPLVNPTPDPSSSSTNVPSQRPSIQPSPESPTPTPTTSPSSSPIGFPSAEPTAARSEETLFPSPMPSEAPSPTIQLSETPSFSPTPRCNLSESQRRDQILLLLTQASSITDIGTQDSPQNLAAEWLIEQDTRFLCPNDPDLVQRYSLAASYYSLRGNLWEQCRAPTDFSDPNAIAEANANCNIEVVPGTGSDAWLTPSSECRWGGVACFDFGNDFEEVVQISLGKNTTWFANFNERRLPHNGFS